MNITAVQKNITQKIPKLRFPGFSGEWEEKRLGDVAEIKRGAASQHLKYVANEEKGIRLLRINDFLNDDAVYVEDTEDIKRFRVKKGDLLIAGTGATAGIVFIVPEKFDDIAFSYNAPRIRVKKANTNFSYLYLKSNLVLRQQKRLFVGNAQHFLDTDSMRGFKINFPSLPEQHKIADFLGAVDKWMENLRKQKDELEAYKKGMMQKIFAPSCHSREGGNPASRIRFKDDNGNNFPEWEEKTIGQVLKIGSGKDYKQLGHGNIPVFGTGGYMLSVNKALYSGESVFIGRKGTINKPFYYKGDFWTVDTLFYTYDFSGIMPKFTDLVFQQINWLKYNEASGVPSLSKTTIEKIKINLPYIAEQQIITKYFTAIEDLINSKQQQITQAEEWKKGLMQVLFI